MAGLTHADEGLTFDAAYDLLGGLDPADLHEWEDELFAKTGQRLRFATRDVSVVDTPEDGVCYRSLHFNDRFDVVQTCVALDAATGGPDHSRPPSLDSQAGTATQGLSLAVALHELSSTRGDRNPNLALSLSLSLSLTLTLTLTLTRTRTLTLRRGKRL